MEKVRSRAYCVSVISIVAIVGAFSICSLLLVNMAGHLYRSVSESNGDSNTMRVALSYVIERVRQMDAEGCIGIEERNGSNILVMRQQGTAEESLLYFKDGILYEEGGAQECQAEAIAKVASFTMNELGDTLIQFTAADKEGNEESVTLSIRSRR